MSLAAARSAFWSALCRFYILASPVLFAAQAVIPVYFLNFELTAVILSVPDGSARTAWRNPKAKQTDLAIGLCFLTAFLEIVWVSAISYCLFTTWFTGKRWIALSAADEVGQQFDDTTDSGRRWCDICEIYKGNRTYHCKQVGKCLPFYDHFCECWLGAVWGYNAKAYLIFFLFIVLHQFACLVVGCWILPTNNPYHYSNWPAWVVGIVSMTVCYSVWVCSDFWKSIGLENVFRTELKSPVRTFWLEDGVFEWQTARYVDSPFNLGPKENIRFVMGPWWSWLLFWTFSPIKDACGLEEFTMRLLEPTQRSPSSSLFVSSILSPASSSSSLRRRRELSSSTAFEDSLESNAASSRRRKTVRSLDERSPPPSISFPAATRSARPKTDPF